MTSSVTSSISVRPAPTPDEGASKASAALAHRPGRDWLGRPLPDKDVWGGLKTKEGKGVNTGDGIDRFEAAALAELARKSPVEFIHRLGADSANGTPVTYRIESPFHGIGTAYAEFTARNGNLLIESGVSIDSETAKNALRNYLAPEDKQNDKPVVGKMTITGKINRAGELGSLKLNGSLANLPKFSIDKIGALETLVTSLLRKLPTGQVITDEMKAGLARVMRNYLHYASSNPVDFFRDVVTSSRAFELDIRSKGSKSATHLDVEKSAVDVQISNLLDEVGKDYPGIDGGTKLAIDQKDRDTLDWGTMRMRSTEDLLVSFEGDRPRLYRIEADGSRTPLRDVFGEILVGLPFLLALLTKR